MSSSKHQALEALVQVKEAAAESAKAELGRGLAELDDAEKRREKAQWDLDRFRDETRQMKEKKITEGERVQTAKQNLEWRNYLKSRKTMEEELLSHVLHAASELEGQQSHVEQLKKKLNQAVGEQKLMDGRLSEKEQQDLKEKIKRAEDEAEDRSNFRKS